MVCAGAWGSEALQHDQQQPQILQDVHGVSAANIVTLSLESVQKHFKGEEVPKKQNIELAVIDATNIADFVKYYQ